MADKLDWLDKHLALLRYITVSDAVKNENYKVRPDLADLFAGVNGAEEMTFKLAKAEKHKEACELLAYVCHRRAGVWWAYRCILTLLEELAQNPAVDRDIAGIAASFDVTVPDFAKVEPPVIPPEVIAKQEEGRAFIEAKRAEARAALDPEMLKYVENAVEVAFQEFKRVHGIHPIDLMKKLAEKCKQDPYKIDPNSPIFQEAAKLKAQLGAVQKQTIDTIKSVIPPKVPEHEKKVRDDALSAVYCWIVAPDEENSKVCLDIGNECPDTPAGLLSLSAFWAFGNLMPGGKQVITTPPGLAANGLVQTLLMCALHKGGTRKVKERYQVYFDLGVDVLGGKDNWEESLAAGKAPHEELRAPSGSGAPSGSAAYKRWKPEVGV
ncbi:MAG: hypothetical protein LBF83_05355 [Spirochaetaceae bacterium]|jgi:hypothetical protein|nr:hypothetical protein [Spirochaetaceae bacterium]